MSERQSIHRNGVLTPKAKEIANPQFAAAQKASIPMIRRIDESRRLTAKDMAFTCNVTDENGGQMSDKTADMLAAWSWYVVRHSHQIADTGDYYGAWELTNGVISLMTEDDSERDDIQAIANAFNESELDFSLDDKAAIDLYISKQEQAEQIEDLTREVARLKRWEVVPCDNCFHYYQHGNPSPWECPKCKTKWTVRDKEWHRERVSGGEAEEI